MQLSSTVESCWSKLIVFSGLPGTGKSTLAEHVAQKHRIPLFARDRLEAAIVTSDPEFPTKREDFPNLAGAGFAILSVLAERQLVLGQSAILDSTARSQDVRDEWAKVASRHNASFHAIRCICSDQKEHKRRLEGRDRGTPDWYELTWEQVQDSVLRFEDWTTNHLTCDSMNPLEMNYSLIDAYIGAQ